MRTLVQAVVFWIIVSKHGKSRQKLTVASKGNSQQSGDSIQNVREPMPAISLIGPIYRICEELKKKVLKKQQPN